MKGDDDTISGCVIYGSTDLFDVAAEPENDINPIPGHSPLVWLSERLAPLGFELSGPHTEDWGWYLDVARETAGWLLGASGSEGEEGRHDWVLQIQRRRSILQRLRGRERMTREDPLLGAVLEAIRAEPRWVEVSEEPF